MTLPSVAQLHAGLALILAVGLHLGAFALRPQQAGAASSGDGGADIISIQAADASLTDMIAAWDRPPERVPEVPPAPLDLVPEAVIEPLPAAIPMAALAMPQMPPPIATPNAPALPQIAPASPVQVQPLAASVRPKPRPAPKSTRDPAPAAKAAATAAARPAQKAAGSGGGTAAGEGGQASSATLSKGQANDLRASWGAAIRARIERRKAYPAAAGRVSGRVTVRLSVSPIGALLDLAVASSSGNAALDGAALRAVTSAGRFPKAPAGLTDSSYSFTLPISFDR